MKVLVQNLQKRDNLATELFKQYDPDVMLLQEINLNSETHSFPANYVSRRGYGTAIGSKFDITNIKKIQSPCAEFGGTIHKKTTVATVNNTIQFVSFHGYNGQPFKDKRKLVEHVDAVMPELSPGPAVFAGDFNTWSKDHLDAVKVKLESVGFQLVYSWPYPGRDYPLDHAFLRGLDLKSSEDYACASDHRGAILEIDPSGAIGVGGQSVSTKAVEADEQAVEMFVSGPDQSPYQCSNYAEALLDDMKRECNSTACRVIAGMFIVGAVISHYCHRWHASDTCEKDSCSTVPGG